MSDGAKIVAYVAAGMSVAGITFLLIARDFPQPFFGILVALYAIECVVAAFGAFWMMYTSYRFDKKPLPLFFLAMFVPFSCLWYYFERVRGKSRKVRRKVPVWVSPNATE